MGHGSAKRTFALLELTLLTGSNGRDWDDRGKHDVRPLLAGSGHVVVKVW